MTILVYFVEVTEYNLALIEQVYRRDTDHRFYYVFGTRSETGHETARALPEDATVLCGKTSDRIRRLNRKLQQEPLDFAIINGYSGAINAWLIRYCKSKGIPYAIESDTQLNIPRNPIKRWIKSRYLQRIFQGKAYGFPGGTRQTKLFQYYGMADDHIFLMPMTVDTERFRRISESHTKEEYKAALGLSGQKVILFVGRFAPVKDIPCLLRAAALLKKTHDDFTVCLIGKGESKPELERMTAELALQPCVRFYDYQLMPKLAEYYSAADVFVLPSSFEPWGLVVNEALACRIPVIASSAVGCVDDLIIPGQNGEVFSCGNAEELYEKLERQLYGLAGASLKDIPFRWNYELYRQKLIIALRRIVDTER